MPDWMKRSENYIPPKGRDRFAGQNALKMISILSVFRSSSYADRRSNFLPSCSVPTKLLISILLILLIACAQNMLFCYIVLAALLFSFVAIPAESLSRVFLTALAASCLSAMIMVPAIFLGSPQSLVKIAVKVFVSVSIAGELTALTPWNELTAGLRFFHLPGVFIFTLDMTLKYILIIGSTCKSMLDALTLRSVGHSKNSAGMLGGIMGTAFLKSRKMSEDTYDAMVCRGFDGEYKSSRKSGLATGDLFWISLSLAFVCLFVWLETH